MALRFSVWEIPCVAAAAMERATQTASNFAELENQARRITTELQRVGRRMRDVKRKNRQHGIRDRAWVILKVLCAEEGGDTSLAVLYLTKKLKCSPGAVHEARCTLETWLRTAAAEEIRRYRLRENVSKRVKAGQKTAEKFRQEAALHKWLEALNVDHGIAPASALLLDRCQTMRATTSRRRTTTSASGPLRKSQFQWLRRWRRRWGVRMGTIPCREHLSPEDSRRKVLIVTFPGRLTPSEMSKAFRHRVSGPA